MVRTGKIYGFKSYYVVWKQSIQWRVTQPNAVFKSYYVVWKHDPLSAKKERKSGFKSYYVVWKIIIYF